MSTDSLTRMRADAGDEKRAVAVRYFLDRPGADMEKSSVRMYTSPPAACKASDVEAFLQKQGLLSPGMLCEIYLDRFQAFMEVDACDASGVDFDLSKSTAADPATLSVRLTRETDVAPAPPPPRQCNMGPCGLFAFSLLMGLEATMIAHELMPTKRIKEPFFLTWACYAFFIGGLLQLLVGILEVFRNNVYGASAFMAFGSFWLANGLQMIIKAYFPAEIPEEFTDTDDPWGHAIRTFYLAGFVGGLFIQTFNINKATTFLIMLLFTKLIFGAFEESVKTCQWITMVLTWMVSITAFCLFGMELTNEVYGREVFDLLPWHPAEPDEAPQTFAAAGRNGAMVVPTHVLELRAARVRERTRISTRK